MKESTRSTVESFGERPRLGVRTKRGSPAASLPTPKVLPEDDRAALAEYLDCDEDELRHSKRP